MVTGAYSAYLHRAEADLVHWREAKTYSARSRGAEAKTYSASLRGAETHLARLHGAKVGTFTVRPCSAIILAPRLREAESYLTRICEAKTAELGSSARGIRRLVMSGRSSPPSPIGKA